MPQPYRFPADTSLTAYTLPELIRVIGQNIFNRRKLWKNIRHPVSEWLHTGHNFYETGSVYINEHYLSSGLKTVDVLVADESGDYYGKAQHAREMFRLLQRVYATSSSFKPQLQHALELIGTGSIDTIIANIGNRKEEEKPKFHLLLSLGFSVWVATGIATTPVFAVFELATKKWPEWHNAFRGMRRVSGELATYGLATIITGRDHYFTGREKRPKFIDD